MQYFLKKINCSESFSILNIQKPESYKSDVFNNCLFVLKAMKCYCHLKIKQKE